MTNVGEKGSQNPARIDTVVLVKAIILGCHNGVDKMPGYLSNRNKLATFMLGSEKQSNFFGFQFQNG